MSAELDQNKALTIKGEEAKKDREGEKTLSFVIVFKLPILDVSQTPTFCSRPQVEMTLILTEGNASFVK